MILIGFHPEARNELMESAHYYERQQAGLGHRFLDAVDIAAAQLRRHPLLYPEIEPGIRQSRVVRFPYGLVYQIRADRLEILAVMHLHRQPGYWHERLQ